MADVSSPTSPPAAEVPTSKFEVQEKWAKLYYDRGLATLSAVVLLATAVSGVYTYFARQRQEWVQAEERRAADEKAARVRRDAEDELRRKDLILRKREI